MLDIFIVSLILLGIIIFFLGRNFFDFGLLLLAGAMFFITGALIFSSGWETFNQGEFVIQDINASITGCESNNANCILVQPRLITFPSDLDTNPEVFGFALALMALGFVIGLNGLSVKSDVDKANELSDD